MQTTNNTQRRLRDCKDCKRNYWKLLKWRAWLDAALHSARSILPTRFEHGGRTHRFQRDHLYGSGQGPAVLKYRVLHPDMVLSTGASHYVQRHEDAWTWMYACVPAEYTLCAAGHALPQR